MSTLYALFLGILAVVAVDDLKALKQAEKSIENRPPVN
jgi:hypothetical protein